MDHPFSFNIDITATLKPLDQEILLEMHRKQGEVREKLSTQILRLKEQSVREALVKMGWTPPAEIRMEMANITFQDIADTMPPRDPFGNE